MLIVVDEITPRLRYVFDRIRDFRGVDFHLEVANELLQKEGYYYSQSWSSSQKGMKAAKLLFEKQLFDGKLSSSCFQEEDCLAFDEVTDPLAAIFYHLSRMEEYNYTNYDKHGRFQAKDSFLVRYGWAKKLMTERWMDAFLKDYSQQMEIPFPNYDKTLNLTLTFDIDNTFAFKWKPATRIIGSYFKDLLRFDFQRIRTKTAVLFGGRKDPYDTFDKIIEYATDGTKVQLFWLLGDFDEFDRNVANTSPKHLAFIQQLGTKIPIGLHPSYASNSSDEKLKKEKEILEKVQGKKVLSSRQHFLKLQFPVTYERNISVGFQEDYTLGFGDIIGFRAGTIRKHPFFNILKNREEKYWIHPFSYMDGTFKDYLVLNNAEAEKEIIEITDESHRFGGDFIVIWHNETISEWHNWKGWSYLIEFTKRRIYETNDRFSDKRIRMENKS